MDIEQYLSKFDKFTKDPTLEAMEYLLTELGSPHKKLKFIHVAGTNGKGSICEMLSKILIESGYKVGKFISPNLIKFNDGIAVNNIDISDEDVEQILNILSPKIDIYNQTHEIKVKWFEIITSLALIYFAKQNCDIVILETGLGGTTDCTNIIENPLISVIANIGYDHMDILGNTIEEITLNKAGIIKENSNTVMLYQDTVTPIIENVCINKNNKLHIIQRNDISDYSYDLNYQNFTYKNLKDIKVNLKGKEQIYNAAICLECTNILNSLNYQIPEEAIKNALRNIIHRARFETLNKDPLVIFDGGHNENAIKNFKNILTQYYENKNKVYIVSILKSKDYKTVLKYLLNDKNAIYFFTDGTTEKPYVSKEDLYNEAVKLNKNNNLLYKEKLETAITKAISNYTDNITCIVGSFYIYKNVIEYFSKS